MIPCNICGRDSGAHWIAGYPPAPDSQKMALCALHDTPKNRHDLRLAWSDAMEKSIETATRNSMYFVTRGAIFMLSIYYAAGGNLNIPCLDAIATDHNTLRVTALDGSSIFFPMQHIKRYALNKLQQNSAVLPDENGKINPESIQA